MGSEVAGASPDVVPTDVAVDGAGETRPSRSLLAEESDEDEFIIGIVGYSRVREFPVKWCVAIRIAYVVGELSKVTFLITIDHVKIR